MPTYRYRAMTQVGEVVSGSLDAPDSAEVAHRIEYLGLIPIEAVTEESRSTIRRRGRFALFSQPRNEDVTIFTGDLALLLRTDARINEALELLSADASVGRMRATISSLAAAILSGESFAEAISRHPDVFPTIYVSLVRIGESSGTLVPILEALSVERQRAEALRRRMGDALRYPAFLLVSAGGVLIFFLTVVLPQFANVFRDFNAKLDPVLVAFLGLSDFVRANGQALGASALCALLAILLLSRSPSVRAGFMNAVSRLPVIRPIISDHRAALFCRNLGLLLSSGVTLTASLRILADMMVASGASATWSRIVDKVRQGDKLSDALSAYQALPQLAVRTLRLGEESGQLPMLAGRIATFYEAKLQRSLDRLMGIAGPLAIVVISLIVGGLIVLVVTALLSVNQVVD
ncbi:type II secretion system F family protein [Methylocapsa sp. S129]|uniref:type II secretion system F family protein n=1 Tax=Methylocapsa sp. S129 TaxID=1641869 RepID=UPI00131DC33F|nr:type II secretion system F family protein [Methylocapsa sp. S129]